MLAKRAVPALVCAVGLCTSVDVAMAVGQVAPGKFKCPCQAAPYPGMTKTKDSATYPNGDKLKLVCTNQSSSGNFQTKYCKANGAQVCIGECVYPKGQNEYCFTYDARGNLCTFTHKNIDPGRSNPNHQKKVYVFDRKAGTVTTTCYKRLADGSYMQVGTPTCRRVFTANDLAVEAVPGQFGEGGLSDVPEETKDSAAATAESSAQESDSITSLAVEALPTGARDIGFFTPGGEPMTLRQGDRFRLHGVGAGDLTRLNEKLRIEIGADGLGVDLVATVDGELAYGERLVRVGSRFTGAFDVHANSVGSEEMTRLLVASQCAEIALDDAVFQGEAVDTYANIESSPLSADPSHDGVVDSVDLALVLGSFGDNGGPSDVNRDGIVNGDDLLVLLTYYGYREE